MCSGVGRLWASCHGAGWRAWPSLRLALERRHFLFELLHLAFERRALTRREVGDGAGETGVADPVGAVGRRRQISALYLVRALRSGLDALQAPRDGEIDGAVV